MADTEQRHLTEGEAGLHRDGEKARLVDYLDWSLILEAGQIAAINNAKNEDYPEGKYPDLDGGIPNYKGGIRATKMLDSAMRHLIAVIQGEDLDPESGKRHLAHMICNINMVSWTLEHRPDLDDRLAKPARRPDPSLPVALVETVFNSVGGTMCATYCPHCGIRMHTVTAKVPHDHTCSVCGGDYRVEHPHG